MLPLPKLGSCTSPGKEHERTFSNVIFDYIKLRKLDPSEDTATKRSCWVYYTRMPTSLLGLAVHTIFYNTQWRGLAELLISMERQCEGRIWWDKRGSFSHVFFVSVGET